MSIIPVAIIVPALFTVTWSYHVLTVSADNLRETWPTVVFGSARTIRSRSARDMQEMRSNTQGLELSSDLKTTGQKFSSDEYHTLSSLTSDNSVVDDPPVTPKMGVHSQLTIADSTPPPLIPPPPPQSFITRSRYVGSNPQQFGGGGDGRAYRPDIFIDSDQIPEYSTSNVNAFPKWNSKYYTGHRQLKKYGPMIMETDLTMTDSSGGSGGMYNGYDNGLDYGQIEADSYRNQIGGDGSSGDNTAVGWYTEPATMASSRPMAEIRDPGSSSSSTKFVSLDVKKLIWLAVIKAVLAKLKFLAILKFLAVLFVKAKLVALLKVFLFAKFTVMSRLFKLCVLPFVPSMLLWLRSAALMQLNPTAAGMAMNTNINTNTAMADMGAGQLRNDSAADPVHMRSTDLNAIGTAADLFQFVANVQSAKCAERTACRVASIRPLGFQSVWLNWILSSMVNYIPNKKLKSYMLTFKDVSDYRLDNIFSHPSTEEWLKWCDERYYCDEE
ncbi:uncharacterized protein LOC112690593 [Sipha flava]|uniref:Uncharacterized protein LOC112690593 n=2 Tax=Sipha flava TaxID=143950 RepID=A0A8B8GB35_9HEMI|nr:uncharacterized protein LOC112690593 [Sipha flava]